jgi:hypothetical protein
MGQGNFFGLFYIGGGGGEGRGFEEGIVDVGGHVVIACMGDEGTVGGGGVYDNKVFFVGVYIVIAVECVKEGRRGVDEGGVLISLASRCWGRCS